MEPRQLVNDLLVGVALVTLLLAAITAWLAYHSRKELIRAERLRLLRIRRNTLSKRIEDCDEENAPLELVGSSKR